MNIVLRMPIVRLRAPKHWTKAAAVAVAAGVKRAEVGEEEVREERGVLVMGRPKAAAMVVGVRRATRPVRTRKELIP